MMSKNSIFVLCLLTLFAIDLLAQPSKDSTKFRGVFIHDLNYQGYNYGVFVFETDVFDLMEIIERKFELEAIPVLRDFSAYSCDYLQCVVYHDVEENELGIELYDCQADLVLRLSSPSYIRFPIGDIEIPKKRPSMQSALKKALQDTEALTSLFNRESESDETVVREVQPLQLEEGESQFSERDRDLLEGEYELLSLEFPVTTIRIKKEKDRYILSERRGPQGDDKQILCEFSVEETYLGYSGHWNLEGGEKTSVLLKFKRNGNLTLFFDKHFNKKIKFEKVKSPYGAQPF